MQVRRAAARGGNPRRKICDFAFCTYTSTLYEIYREAVIAIYGRVAPAGGTPWVVPAGLCDPLLSPGAWVTAIHLLLSLLSGAGSCVRYGFASGTGTNAPGLPPLVPADYSAFLAARFFFCSPLPWRCDGLRTCAEAV